MVKKAFITGISGQDAAYLAGLLLNKGYAVYGGVRRSAERSLWRLSKLGIKEKIEIVDFDLLDRENIYSVLLSIKPDEIYNLAAMSFVGTSFKQPELTQRTNGDSVFYMLEIIKNYLPDTKFYQASTSEMYGRNRDMRMGTMLDEESPMKPASPYALSKLYAHNLVRMYREAYGIFACDGILFNHESSLRGDEFVTKKITNYVRRYKYNKTLSPLLLGNIYAKRDWGYARDYVEAMYRIMQHSVPSTYVVATGRAYSVKHFVNKAFEEIGIHLSWVGENLEEYAYDASMDYVKPIVKISKEYYRPNDVHFLLGDSSLIQKELGWEADTNIDQLIYKMINDED